MSRSLPRSLFKHVSAIQHPLAAAGLLLCLGAPAWAVDYPITPGQRGTAQKVAEAGVPLSELAPNAPDSYTVKRRDTLWDISKIFLKTPWRWPELWGMNLQEIRNPHLIYPGQILYLDKTGGRARLRLAKPVGPTTDKLSPRIRPESLEDSAIASVPMSQIGAFLNEAVVFDSNQLDSAPRIVATQEGRVMVSRGEKAYVRGDVTSARSWQVFRQPKPLRDPTTGEVLGYEARYVGIGDVVRAGESRAAADGKTDIVPATLQMTRLREEVGVGDRLAPAASSDYDAFAPHSPAGELAGQVVSIYGDGLNAGQNQIVALNHGARDGMERGHVLALSRNGLRKTDVTSEDRASLVLPDERHGLLFVFRVFERVSYALILQAQDPVKPGDRFSQP
jgi:hypothetical protein